VTWPQELVAARLYLDDGRTIECCPAGFGPEPQFVSARVVRVEPALADGPIVNAAEVDGSVALVKRGGNLFQDKAKLVQAAGAIGMVVINNSDELFTPLGSEGHQSVRIPVVAIAAQDAALFGGAGECACATFALREVQSPHNVHC
jgi:hypothetical protein